MGGTDKNLFVLYGYRLFFVGVLIKKVKKFKS